jgi:hypothetical protein
VDHTTNTVSSVSSTSNSNASSSTNLVSKNDLPQNFIEAFINNIDKICKQNSGSYVYNNFNINIINKQTNEITRTNNEVNITENNQINNNTKTNNVNIEENINNNITTINNYNTNYNIFNNSFFDYISHKLDKGCVNENPTIRAVSKVSKYSYIAFCVSVNFGVNTAIRAFKVTKWVFTQFKDFDKIFKGMVYFIVFVVILTSIYRNEYCWNFVKQVIKNVFHKSSASPKSSIPPVTTTEIPKIATQIPKITTQFPENLSNNIPNNLSELNEKIQSAVSAKEIIKLLLKKSTEMVYSAYNQTEHFIVDSSKNAIDYTYKMVNSTTPMIKDTSYQIYSAINSTIAGSIPLIQKSSDKIQSAVNSTVSAIWNNEKLNNIAHSVKDTITNNTPKAVVSSGNEIYNFIDNKVLKDPYVNSFFNKIKNIFNNTTTASVENTTKVIENVQKINEKVVENASTASSVVTDNENTVKRFVKHITSKIYKRD